MLTQLCPRPAPSAVGSRDILKLGSHDTIEPFIETKAVGAIRLIRIKYHESSTRFCAEFALLHRDTGRTKALQPRAQKSSGAAVPDRVPVQAQLPGCGTEAEGIGKQDGRLLSHSIERQIYLLEALGSCCEDSKSSVSLNGLRQLACARALKRQPGDVQLLQSGTLLNHHGQGEAAAFETVLRHVKKAKR
eukprot:scaffold7387_cov231-Pinguiococcus_pyrenoidosus.AAC.1